MQGALRAQQVNQGLYVVSNTCCPAFRDCKLVWKEARQRPQRRWSPVEHKGTFVCPVWESQDAIDSQSQFCIHPCDHISSCNEIKQFWLSEYILLYQNMTCIFTLFFWHSKRRSKVISKFSGYYSVLLYPILKESVRWNFKEGITKSNDMIEW